MRRRAAEQLALFAPNPEARPDPLEPARHRARSARAGALYGLADGLRARVRLEYRGDYVLLMDGERRVRWAAKPAGPPPEVGDAPGWYLYEARAWTALFGPLCPACMWVLERAFTPCPRCPEAPPVVEQVRLDEP